MKKWLIAAGCSAALLFLAAWLLFALTGWYWPETRWYSIGSLVLLVFATGTILFYNNLDDK